MHGNSLTRTWWVRACWPASTPNHAFSCRYARIAEVEVLTDGRLMLKWAHDTIGDAEDTIDGCLMVGARVVFSWATDDGPTRVQAPNMASITACVICGRTLRSGRDHVDTCGARCFQALLRHQREEAGRC